MDVKVHHRLPGCNTVVNADIETIGAILSHQKVTGLIQQFPQCRPLLLCCLEQGSKMALGDNQTMSA